MGMAESQYVTFELVGPVVAAQVLREKITEHENGAIENDLVAAAETHGWRLAVDLSQVMMLSSAGLGGLISLHNRCEAGGGKLVVYGIQDQIMQLMALTRLDKLLIFAPDRKTAIQKAAA